MKTSRAAAAAVKRKSSESVGMNAWPWPRERAAKGQRRDTWQRTDTDAFLNARKGTEVISFRGTQPKPSTSNLAALGSSTSCGNDDPWRKKSIFNLEGVLHIRRLNGTQIFCPFNSIQLSRNGSSPFIKSDALAVELGGPSPQTLNRLFVSAYFHPRLCPYRFVGNPDGMPETSQYHVRTSHHPSSQMSILMEQLRRSCLTTHLECIRVNR